MFFVFFKQKTAYEMRISDWSSDVCSSDLRPNAGKDRALTRGGKQLVAGIEQRVSTVAADILQFEGKTAGDAEFGDSGGIEGKDHGLLDRCKEAHRRSDQR